LYNLKSKGTGSLEQASKPYSNNDTLEPSYQAKKHLPRSLKKPAVLERWISFQPSRSATIIGRTSNISLLVASTTQEPATCLGERTSPK
jgi:hypothetical protein